MFFYDCILRCVVGKLKWKRLIRRNSLICREVTVSDEAFALLALENGWAKWEKIHREKSWAKMKRKKLNHFAQMTKGRAIHLLTDGNRKD